MGIGKIELSSSFLIGLLDFEGGELLDAYKSRDKVDTFVFTVSHPDITDDIRVGNTIRVIDLAYRYRSLPVARILPYIGHKVTVKD